MFETAFADIAKKPLQLRNVHDAGTAKSFQRIVGEISFTNIAADFSLAIVRGDTDKTHGTGFDSSHAGAKGIFLAHRSGDDFLEIHADVLEKMLGKIAAVKTNSLSGSSA